MGRLFGEPVLAKQRYEPDIAETFNLEFIPVAGDQSDHLGLPVSKRNDQSTTWSELLQQGFRNLRRRRRDQDGIERRIGTPSQRAVPDQHGHVPNAGLGEDLSGGVRQRGNPLDAENLSCQDCEQRGLIA